MRFTTRFAWLLLSCAVACSIQDPENQTPPGTGGASSSSGPGTGGGLAVGGGGSVETPGSVQCGKNTCTLPDEKCCGGSENCVAAADACPQVPCAFVCEGAQAGSLLEKTCDDIADCKDGQVCCLQPVDATYVALVCGDAPCEIYEACIPGGECSAGLTCLDAPAEPTGALCGASDAAVPCGESLVCEGATPICCNAGSPSCVAPGADCAADFWCNGVADCGAGYHCCAGAGESHCAGSCASELCETAADCTGGGTCDAATYPGYPAGFKVCN